VRSLKRATRTVAILLLLSQTAFAQDSELPDVSTRCAPEVVENRSTLLLHSEQQGMWFHMAVARCMLTRLQALPLYAERVSLLEQRLELGDERTALLRRQVELAEEGERQALAVLDASEGRARRAEERADRERTLRWVWFGVGVVVVVAIEALALWAWSELSD